MSNDTKTDDWTIALMREADASDCSREECANSLLAAGDFVDAPSTSVHLPHEVARRLLRRAGWRQDDQHRYISPEGDNYWSLDEALFVQLVAEAIQ
jgi:hypothetical protein